MKKRIHALLNKITMTKFGVAFGDYDEMEKLQITGELLDYIEKELKEIDDETDDSNGSN
jgi:hypothetical protein